MHSILNYIIRHTNKYGEDRCKDWSITNYSDIITSICVNFVGYIQNRKYKPYNWFSNYPLLDKPMTKIVITGNTSHRTPWYLYVFSLYDQPSPNYEDQSPTYNIQEFKYSFDRRFNRTFIQGDNLILDENIICYFGCIKFKFRMVKNQIGMGSRSTLLQMQKLHLS